MSVLSKSKGLQKKLATLSSSAEAREGVVMGIYHYHNKDTVIEELKNERAKICGDCDSLKYDDFEPIKDEDERISGKMCGECFCSLPYLLRQTKKSCELKKWK